MINIDGFQGNIGNIGLTGPNGNEGIIGYQGLSGNIGLPGKNGDIGITGPMGLRGFDGPNGNDGKLGITGPIGSIGIIGDMGPQGPPGSLTRGPNGKNGYEALLSTLQKNQVINALSGSVTMDQLINISDNIISGTVHCPIVMGKENAIANGILDKGNGQYSVNCAYVNLIYPDIYYSPQGYIKLNENFLNSISVKGPTGFSGQRGPIGQIGPVGYPGKPGPTGPMGENGLPGQIGIMGPRGPLGLSGNDGLNGNIGLTGPNGDKGSIGLQGNPGPSYIGPQGFGGYTGFVTIDFPKCKPILESNVLTFNCPTNTWLTSIKNNNGKFSGLCCPLVVGDNNEPSTFDIGLDGKQYPSPQTKIIEKAYDAKSLDNKYNISWNTLISRNFVSNNDQNVINENKTNTTIGMAQSELINDVIFFGRNAGLL